MDNSTFTLDELKYLKACMEVVDGDQWEHAVDFGVDQCILLVKIEEAISIREKEVS